MAGLYQLTSICVYVLLAVKFYASLKMLIDMKFITDLLVLEFYPHIY